MREILRQKEAKKWIMEAVKAKRMQDEPNKLIRELLNSKRAPTEEDIKKILDHVAKAPCSTRPVPVNKSLRGQVFQGHEQGKSESSIIAHLAKRVLLDQEWAETVTIVD